MTFWATEDGTAITPEKEYSAGGGGDFEPLPKNTNVLVAVEETAWKAGYQVSEEFVNLKVRVLKPEGYANRVLFFKLWVDELDPSVKDRSKATTKRDKHKKMLMAIDANAKSRLAKLSARPTDEQLALALIGAQFVATLGVWDKDDGAGGKAPGGNWLMSCKAKTAEVSEGPAKAKPRPTGGGTSNMFDDDLDDDVPFVSREEGIRYRRVI